MSEDIEYLDIHKHSGNHVDWRNCASDELKDIWDTLTNEQKSVIAECLERIAYEFADVGMMD